MFANLIIDSTVPSYRYNESESLAAFAVLEKLAGFAGALIQSVRALRVGLDGMIRVARA